MMIMMSLMMIMIMINDHGYDVHDNYGYDNDYYD